MNANPIFFKYMKTKLQEHFGDKIVFTERKGKSDVVTFFRTARSILQEFHQQQQRANDANTEKVKIIEAAANLIKTYKISEFFI